MKKYSRITEEFYDCRCVGTTIQRCVIEHEWISSFTFKGLLSKHESSVNYVAFIAT